jgi:hypothetical protein
VPKGLYRVIFLVSSKETMEYWSLAKARNFIIGTGRHYFDIIWYLCSNDDGHFIYISHFYLTINSRQFQLTHRSLIINKKKKKSNDLDCHIGIMR